MGNDYVWASSDQERQRLASQGDLLRPATERLFRAAGIGPGARVLDCGSGGGDVSVIVAELVAPSGQVLGIDRDAAQVEAATKRARELGLSQVRFDTADLCSPPDGPFDAIVGRLVLMYQRDVWAVLRLLADRLAPGGVAAFLEMNVNPPQPLFMWPVSPLVEQLVRWVDAAWKVLGNQTHMGARLPSLLRSAGLKPQLPYEVAGGVVTGDDAVLQFLLAMLAGIAPVLTANGIASEEQVNADRFAERVKAEISPDPVLIVSSPSLAVWAKKP
jgi:ubiquinone/menaquinone biosynthesis C-methylase UbiE